MNEMKKWLKDAEIIVGDGVVYHEYEVGTILGLYGRNSPIFNEMANGRAVSGLIEKSIKKNKIIGREDIVKIEESLLSRCLKREKEHDLSV